MRPDPKIATCCYCGQRSVLRFVAGQPHELRCASCGAPLSQMKALPERRRAEPASAPEPRSGKAGRKPKKKPRKRGLVHLLGKAFDEIEDLFD